MNPQPPTDTRIPVTILTGFLGSGKTTLLNRVLTAQHGKRIAVIENEYGEVGIDQALVVNADEEIFEMNNGCICCTVRGDLIRILGNLRQRRDRFDYVLVETTGLADPGPVAQTFFVDDEVREHYRLDGIVTLVDARHVWQHLDDSSECQEQIAFADKIILNKIDLATPEDVDRLEERIRSMNRAARIHRVCQAEVPMEEVLNVRAFDLGAKLEVDADFLKEELPFEWGGEFELEAGRYELVFEPGPDPLMGLVVLPLDGADDDSRAGVRKQAVQLFGEEAIRRPRRSELNPGPRFNKLLFDDDGAVFHLLISRPGRYVLFTQHLPAEFRMTLRSGDRVLAAIRENEYAAAHTHDATVSSVGIVESRPADQRRLGDWLSELLRTRGRDLFRMKGVLHIAGSPNRFVFQGVHMLFDGQADRPWKPGEERLSQLIFIGRHLDREVLNAGFRRCLTDGAGS